MAKDALDVFLASAHSRRLQLVVVVQKRRRKTRKHRQRLQS
jgi:hypothetical protein